MMRIAIYPDPFDPVSLGHVEIVQRVRRLFDLTVLFVCDPLSAPAFSLEERLWMLRQTFAADEKLVIGAWDAVQQYEKENCVYVRPMATRGGFEGEPRQAKLREKRYAGYETLYLPVAEGTAFFTAGDAAFLIREGMDLRDFFPDPAILCLREKLPFLSKRDEF